MKKILTLILLATLFVACGDDDDPEDKRQYIDNSLIEGKWYWLYTPYDSTVMWFTDDACIEIDYSRTTHAEKRRLYHGEYKLTEDRIFYLKVPSGKGLKYRLDGGNIWIENGANTDNFIKYIKVKE